MGVLNVTPDSFSDGGQLFSDGQLQLDALCRRAEAMLASGADLLDIGGESTRPGAAVVSEAEELDRVLPAVEAIASRFDTMISLDTSTPAVMRDGAARGASLINDVRALRRPGALEAAAETGLPVCLMHMQGEPDTMQQAPRYDSVVEEVAAFLTARAEVCMAAGIPEQAILLDPGFGFGKTVEHNFALLAGLPALAGLGYPLLAGLSRKSMIAKVIAEPALDRLPASVTLAVLAAERGARILRVHDVAATRDGLAMLMAMETYGQ
ncbi:MAG: dihydropteroate synthase [Halieaceae bacterium]|jgi:dihydropteroate synthase|nr:dihydropteroate synthase [Halieaceae bacterium]